MGQKPSSSQQQRKQRVLEEVQRQRKRRRAITLAVIGIVLVAIIVGGIYALTHQSGGLPAYLNECVTGTNPYHAHVHLAININGVNQTVPAAVGIIGACLHPLHTHSTDGVIHVEPHQDRDFTLGDFFLIWGQPFNSTQVMFQKYQPGQLLMTVSGAPNTQYWNYGLPRNAQTAGNPCSSSPCVETDIVITYSSTAQTS